jgi:hypothetical protein
MKAPIELCWSGSGAIAMSVCVKQQQKLHPDEEEGVSQTLFHSLTASFTLIQGYNSLQ